MKLNEYKNISDEVYGFSVMLYDRILKECRTSSKKKSRINGLIYNEETFILRQEECREWIFNGISELTVTYTMYYADSLKFYNYILNDIGFEANSYSDYDDRTLVVVSGFIEGYPASDLLGTLCHEVNHLFEYDNGREKRVSLYDKCLELIRKGNEDETAYAVGQACYYTFQHEIDAFVHQFYGFLCQEEPDHLSYEQLLNYSPYKVADNVCRYVKSKKSDPNIKKWIKYLGYNNGTFLKRLHFGLQKMETKMRNAYQRYRQEKPQVTEGRVNCIVRQELNRLFELKEYGCNIEWGVERLYNF